MDRESGMLRTEHEGLIEDGLGALNVSLNHIWKVWNLDEIFLNTDRNWMRYFWNTDKRWMRYFWSTGKRWMRYFQSTDKIWLKYSGCTAGYGWDERLMGAPIIVQN